MRTAYAWQCPTNEMLSIFLPETNALCLLRLHVQICACSLHIHCKMWLIPLQLQFASVDVFILSPAETTFSQQRSSLAHRDPFHSYFAALQFSTFCLFLQLLDAVYFPPVWSNGPLSVRMYSLKTMKSVISKHTEDVGLCRRAQTCTYGSVILKAIPFSHQRVPPQTCYCESVCCIG